MLKFNSFEERKTMKCYFFFSIFCFFFETQAAFSRNFPFMAFTTEGVQPVFNESQVKDLDCDVLMKKQWVYSSGQVSLLCDEAINTCLIQGLIEQKIKETQGDELKELKIDLIYAQFDTERQLMGCQLAIEGTQSNKPLNNVAGYPSY